MIDVFLMLMHEINMSVHNLIYLVVGFILSQMVASLFKRKDFLQLFYYDAVDLFNEFKRFDNEQHDIVLLYNNIIIRSICILALGGEFCTRDRSFIDHNCNQIKMNKETVLLIREISNRFLDKICKLSQEKEKMSVNFLTDMLAARRKK